MSIETYYDESTGRTLTIVDADEYSVIRRDVMEDWHESKRRQAAIERGGIRNYVTAYHGPVRKLNDILSLNELGAIMKLLPYIRFDRGGALMDGEKRMGVVEVACAIGKAKRWTVEIIASLTRSGVLTAEKEKRRLVYNVSEAYHTIGRVIEGTPYTKIYQMKTRTDIAKVSIQAAGFLYKMIPFIHYEYLYLSCNPNERDRTKIRHLSQARFARETGIDDETASRCMRELIAAGFVMRSEAFGAKIIRMNPDVMFRKRKEFDAVTNHIRSEFEQARNAADSGDSGVIDVDEAELPF